MSTQWNILITIFLLIGALGTAIVIMAPAPDEDEEDRWI